MEQPTGGADEWFSSDVLLVAGLLSDKTTGAVAAPAEHRLRGVPVEIIGGAGRGRLPELAQRRAERYPEAAGFVAPMRMARGSISDGG